LSKNGQKEIITIQNSTIQPIQVNVPEYISCCGLDVMTKDLLTKYTWYQALGACPEGWRLPTIRELECLCNNTKYLGYIGKQYWSSDDSYKDNYAKSRTFNDCKEEVEKKGDRYFCRCVRNR